MRSNLINKKFQLKMIREKQITIIKMRIKVNIKIKFQWMKLKNKHSKQNIYIAIKSLMTKYDIISK
jgi:ribosome-associated translation inhibitor RaiA